MIRRTIAALLGAALFLGLLSKVQHRDDMMIEQAVLQSDAAQ